MSDRSRTNKGQLALIALLCAAVAGLTAAVVVILRTDEPQTAPATTTASTAPASSLSTTTTVPASTTTTVPPTTTTTSPPAQVLTFEAIADTSVDNSSPEEPMGDLPELVIDGDEDETVRALIAFQVEGLPLNLAQMSATLRVAILDSSDTQGSVSAVAGAWDESTTWNDAPEVGDPISAIPVVAEGSTVELDVTEAVQGNGYVAFYLTVESSDDIKIASRDSGARAPVLVVSIGGATEEFPLMVGAGDIADCGSDGDEATAGLVEAFLGERDPAVVFTLGDSVYETGTLEAYEECYDPSWGAFRDVTRPVPGSRDYAVSGASGYFDYFGARAGGADGYYSYNLGSWAVFALNSNCDRIGGCGPESPQYEWFVSELDSTEALCVAAYWQRPVYTSGPDGGDSRMEAIFAAAADGGVDVIMNSNDHLYERFAPRDDEGEFSEEGVRQFIVGTGGRSLETPETEAELSEFVYDQSFGVLALELYNGSYLWSFTTVDEGEVDAGSAACS